MRARLNLATKPLETHRRFLVGAGLAGSVAGLVFLVLGWNVYQMRQQERDYRAKSEKMESQAAGLQEKRQELDRFFHQPDNAKLSERAAYLNSLMDARSFNWTLMFMDLERLMPGGVRLTSITPKQASGHVEVKLTVGATSDEAKIKFLRALEASKEFSHVELEKEQVPASNDGDHVILDLTAWYTRI
jgi:Tfp pilus assembly protein PilN